MNLIGQDRVLSWPQVGIHNNTRPDPSVGGLAHETRGEGEGEGMWKLDVQILLWDYIQRGRVYTRGK